MVWLRSDLSFSLLHTVPSQTLLSPSTVDVWRKTGYLWRAEMGGVIARKRSEGSGRHLSMFERQRIA
jgi:hypothetical protein